MNYWGPLANHKSSDWIVDAIVATMGMPGLRARSAAHLHPASRLRPAAPRPGQRAGAQKALDVLLGYLTRLKAACADFGYDWIFVGDYAIEPVQARRDFSESRAARGRALSRARHSRHGLHRLLHQPRVRRRRSPDRARLLPRRGFRDGRRARCCASSPGVAEVLDREAADGARPGSSRAAANSCSSRKMARGLPTRGSRKRRRRTTPATSISTTSPATTRANFSSAGRRAA